ncbi:MAG: YvrJ family protein [Sarcina sp.]
MENLINLIANVGFPIAITMYLLMRIEVKLDKLTASIEKLTNVLS